MLDKMKPEETRILLQKEFQTVEELQALLAKSIHISNQHPSTIYVDTVSLGDFSTRKSQYCQFTLEAEGLSDGSVVYNISLA